MNPLRALARPLLASAFVLDGIDALRHADEHAEKAAAFQPALDRVNAKVPAFPSDAKTLTRLLGATQVAAGVLFATGKAPRAAAATLALTMIPTAIARHPAWAARGEERKEHLNGLLRSGALLGGLLIATEDREGEPALGWRLNNWREHRAELRAVREEMGARLKELKQSA